MNAQEEIAQLRAEVEQLKQRLGEKQQLAAPTLPSLINDEEFLLLLAKFSDGLESEKSIRERYRLSDADWERLGRDDALVEKIEFLRAARIKSGATRREKAQRYVVAAVDTVNGIVADPKANARHRIDGAKLLDSFAGFTSSEPTADEERVVVTINLGSDVLRFGRAVRPAPNDDKTIDAVPGFMIAEKDDRGGEPL
jgi:hypothetical protein